MSTADEQKKAAALAALKRVKPGMKLGLGTGSTANHFVRALAEEVKKGLQVLGVPTSRATLELAKGLGIPMSSLNEEPYLDLCVDGADEFDPQLNLIKGGGGALLVEKIVASSAKEFIIITDESKKVAKLGAFPLPIEVVNVGVRATVWKIESVFRANGLSPPLSLRGKDGEVFRTDCGNVIIDAACGAIEDAHRLEVMLNDVPGVVNNGLFVGMATSVLMATPKGVQEIKRP
jgi:ribose 5-phosphate isomerase A